MAGFEEVKLAVKDRWPGVLASLGVRSDFLENKHGPCPGCGGRDRFRFDDKDGDGTWLCSQGGGGTISGDGFDLLAHVWGWDKGRCLREVADVVGIHVGNGGEHDPAGVAKEPKEEKGPKRKPYDPKALALFARGCPDAVDREWLAQRSPVRPEWGVRPGLGCDFLSFLYGKQEVVLIFTDFRSQGDFAFYGGRSFRLAGKPKVEAVVSEVPSSAPDGVWFLTNPVTGRWVPMQKGERLGRRHGGCVTAWRYAVLESDEAPFELWLKALVLLAIPIAAIYTSGGKSVHALVRIDARSKGEFDIARDRLVSVLCKLGADGGALSGVRLSRLPGCRRGNKGVQELWYLNPKPRWEERIIHFPKLR